MTTLTSGSKAVNAWDVTQRVEADVAFLKDRLQSLGQQEDPNPIIIETYQGMLANRQQLLGWLLRGNRKIDI
jgi:hypothetical protein